MTFGRPEPLSSAFLSSAFLSSAFLSSAFLSSAFLSGAFLSVENEAGQFDLSSSESVGSDDHLDATLPGETQVQAINVGHADDVDWTNASACLLSLEAAKHPNG